MKSDEKRYPESCPDNDGDGNPAFKRGQTSFQVPEQELSGKGGVKSMELENVDKLEQSMELVNGMKDIMVFIEGKPAPLHWSGLMRN